MGNKEMNLMLVNEFPELFNAYQEEVSWQEGDNTGSHVVYGDVLTPYFINCIEKQSEGKVKKILDFIEKILEIDSVYSNEVITFSVLERVKFEHGNSPLIKKHIGILSNRVLNEIPYR